MFIKAKDHNVDDQQKLENLVLQSIKEKKEWNNAICSNMNGPRDCHTEWSKSDRGGETSYDNPYMRNLKRSETNELTYKIETHRLRERTYGCRGKDGGGGIIRSLG